MLAGVSTHLSPAALGLTAPPAAAQPGGGRASGPEPEPQERGPQAASAGQLTPQERRIVAQLQARDREVRAHEQAHIAAAGGLAGPASFTFTRGPDGRLYATGGEVSIDTSAESSPQATLEKAQRIRAAALAPANPSAQDRAAAAAASQMEGAARAELAAQRRAELEAGQRQRQAAQFGAPGAAVPGGSLNAVG